MTDLNPKYIRVLDLLYLLEDGELTVTLKSTEDDPDLRDTAENLIANCTEYYLLGYVDSWKLIENPETIWENEIVVEYEPYC